MATRGVSMTIHYVAVDATTNMGKTGDAANHTLRWIKDGTPLVPTNSPVEVDATNCPGIYKLTLTASETDCNIGTLGGKSSTANVSIIPKTIEFERLPDAAPGASGGVPVIGQPPLTNLDAAVSSRADATYYTSARAAKLDNLDAAVSTRATASSVWGHSSRSLTTAVDVNMSQSLPSSPGANTVGEALKFADTRLDATVSSRATAANVWGYTTRELTGPVNLNMGQEAPPNPTANTVGDAIKSAARMRFTESDDVYAWAVNASGGGGGTVNINMDQLLPTSPTSGTVGEALKFADTRLDATVGSRATEAGVWNYTTRTLTGTVNLNMNQSVPASPTANTVGDSMKSAARIRFTDSDDVYAWAVNESGGGGGGGGNGPYAVTITVYEGQTPLEGASVRLMLGAEDYSLVTNASGRCTFYVGAGTWRWRVAKPGYMGQSATVAISEDKQLNVSLEKVIVSPSPPGQTTGYAIVYDEQGAVEPGVTVYCRLVQLNVYGVVGDTQQRSAQSNQQGVVEFPGLVKGATYAFRRSNGVERMLRVPLDAGDTIELPPLMGEE